MKKIYSVVLCGPAVGKTYLSNNDSRFIDLDEKKAKYKYNIKDDNINFEKNKLNRGKVVHEDSLDYAINILNDGIKSERIVLISYNKEILDYVINNRIKYCLVFPSLNSREEYIYRMKKRGNNEKFIEAMTNEKDWNSFYERNRKDMKPMNKIELKKGEYLSDIKDKFFK